MFDWLKKLFSKPAPAPVADNRIPTPSQVAEDGMPTKPCQTCGKPIQYDPTWKHIPNYCADCKAKYREEHADDRVRRKCRGCGKTFTVPASLEHKPNYCRNCKAKFDRRKKT